MVKAYSKRRKDARKAIKIDNKQADRDKALWAWIDKALLDLESRNYALPTAKPE